MSASESEELDVEVHGGRIAALRRPRQWSRDDSVLHLRGCLILPGLINAHDHLEFNLFPRLGRGPFQNAAAWARDIYHPEESPVREHLLVPMPVRLAWGGIKNLLSGVTTICHHNPYHPGVFGPRFPARVHKRYGWAHSLEFSPDLVRRFRRTAPGRPFLLHLGEAIDRGGKLEIFRLDSLRALDRRTVLIHAVALNDRGLQVALERGASLVWCPSSNLFILGKTLRRPVLESGIPIALGTDSALSGQGDLLDELRAAGTAAKVSAARLYSMVTEDAARILRLDHGAGTVAEGAHADLMVLRDQNRTPAASLLGTRTGEMELILVAGRPRLISPEFLPQLPVLMRRRLRPIVIEGGRKTFLDVNLPRLFREATRVLGPDLRLAGKRVRIP